MWGATLRLMLSNQFPPIKFEAIASWVDVLWALIGVIAPPLVLFSWWIIKKGTGKIRYLAFWFRFGGDVAMFSYVLAYHLAENYIPTLDEGDIFGRYLVAACLIFLLFLVFRDLLSILMIERTVSKLRRLAYDE
jgi:hypothetical protein